MRFKCRASAISQIMTNGRGKNTLSKTAKSYVEQWYKEQLYGRKKEFTSKYTEKGNITEDKGIEIISEDLGLGKLVFKNKEYFENDYLTGTPDIIIKNKKLIVDHKSSWDCFTFPLFEEEVDKAYYDQMQGYMDLTDSEEAVVSYVLHNTPDELIEKEAYYKSIDNGFMGTNDDILEEVRERHTYSHLNKGLTIKHFHIKRDDEYIKAIHNRVDQLSGYLQTIRLCELENM